MEPSRVPPRARSSSQRCGASPPSIAMVARREAGEPLQYVVGRWSFRHLDLMVDQPGSHPPTRDRDRRRSRDRRGRRPRSARGRETVVADLGTGSGAIALADRLVSARLGSGAGHRRVARGPGRRPGQPRRARARRRAGQPPRRLLVRSPPRQCPWRDRRPRLQSSPYIGDDEVLPSVVGDWEPRRRPASRTRRATRTWSSIVDGAAVVGQPITAVRSSSRWRRPRPGPGRRTLAGSQGWQATDPCQDLAGRDRAVVARKH